MRSHPRALMALAAAVAVSVLTVSAPAPAGAQPAPESGRGRRPEPAPADSCGNVLLRGVSSSRWPRPTTPRPIPGPPRTSGINDRGQIVGGYLRGRRNARRPGLLSARCPPRRAARPPRPVPAASTSPVRSSPSPTPSTTATEIVGQYIDAGCGPDAEGRLPHGTVHGFLRHRGEVTTIDVPGAALTQPLGINNRGDVVGAYLEAVPTPTPTPTTRPGGCAASCFATARSRRSTSPAAMGTKVSGINDRGEMVGYYDTHDTTAWLPAARRPLHRDRSPRLADQPAERHRQPRPRRRRLPRPQRHQRPRLPLGGREVTPRSSPRARGPTRSRSTSTTAATS